MYLLLAVGKKTPILANILGLLLIDESLSGRSWIGTSIVTLSLFGIIHQRRVNLLNSLHKTNLIRPNKAMMYGGKVELRTPFLDKDFVEYGLGIPPQY